VNSMKYTLDMYRLIHRRYPQTIKELITPSGDINPTKRKWPYGDLTHAKLIDPWGMPYQYMSPGQHNPRTYDLWSHGPDGMPDTGDEIGNW